jgi:hypothetical protein
VRRKMKDARDADERLLHNGSVSNVTDNPLNGWEMRGPYTVTMHRWLERVEDANLVTKGDKACSGSGADEPTSSCYQDPLNAHLNGSIGS